MNRIFKRTVEKNIKRHLFDKGKISVIYGPRQVGKTTLAKKILKSFGCEKNYFNCEDMDIKRTLMSQSATQMWSVFGGHKLIVFDEAQTVENIGRSLKILIDAHPEMSIIATGSSSFDLASKINEPLTGRHYEYFLFPLALSEIGENIELLASLEQRMVFGCYPEVVNANNIKDARTKLKLIASSYLYRDILSFSHIKSPEILTKILVALARQIGGEVSYNEIASLVGIDRKTVMSYINLLEQAFIIFKMPPLLTNRRDEVKKLRKIYFYDNGILNAIIDEFNDSATGRDMGPLWENLMISERKKFLSYHQLYRNTHYWRTKSGQEVDYVESYDGKTIGYEFKNNNKKTPSTPSKWENPYSIITPDNFFKFLH
jgi:predicted AAA+ superfamily ATPase